MEKHPGLHLTCFALSLSVIFCGSTIYYASRESAYARYTETIHEQSLSQLVNSMTQLETSLEKANYLPDGAMRQTLAADVWKESQLASEALASLPLGDQRLEQVETYLAQVGDYAYYLMRSAAYERANAEEWATFCSLAENAMNLLAQVDQLKTQIDARDADFRQIDSAGKAEQVDQQLATVNEEFPEYASLIYDGPYSDHVFQRTAKALEGLRTYSRQEALTKAAALFQVPPDRVTYSFETEGQIPGYGFSSGTVSCTISKQGGLALALTDNRALGNAVLTSAQAVEKAQEFLNSMGLVNMKPSYHTTYETICTINFSYMDNDIVVYPDLVKVGIALDNGTVVRLDTAGYAMNHHEREAATPAVSVDEARKNVPETLSVQKEGLALIPTTGHNEVLCWEFACKAKDGTQALLYVNAEQGQVENLLLLIEDENGTLTR